MLDIAAELHGWTEQDRDFAVATVVAVSGSAPRRPGAALAVDAGGTVIGSVSGGCVEGAVYDLCRQAIEDGHPVRERFGYSDDDAFAGGPSATGWSPRTRGWSLAFTRLDLLEPVVPAHA
ncbi:XdhC family protein, partial [Streptomyces albidoflavus]